ncbi:hypothetical protein APR41_13895 [Salegentibacter salinarum]|uniref:Uncharacterized protein n=1 Tax=Salegentibacter salinarum TaxID=447422 RepID=A0A2N0U057_9FLAO|nr:hypothetical protein [Salegentibacter salinarum]PKD20367.1 hypothetical protein APR41_13895 [Salegentibacter salinarum]SKB85594.1 hypothetical protein SAMN05660903_02910 [Salegentibacter salinarum]
MISIWYILFFIVLFILIFFWRKRHSNRDSKTDNIKAKKEDFNPEFSSKPETEEEEEGSNKK